MTEYGGPQDALEDISKDDFEKFCHQLLDRREAPRVKRNRVENKNRLQIADVLVSHFTEEGALRVTVDLLKAIGCRDEAETLGEINVQVSTFQPHCHKEHFGESFLLIFSYICTIRLQSVTGEHTCEAQDPKHIFYYTFIQPFFLPLKCTYHLLMPFALLSYTMSGLLLLFLTNFVLIFLSFLSLLQI
uniref:Pyrin domain-containing protein n=1 Tax=Pundamilia nyererei TaxID=303518 RepID=A0A3B4GQL5_9CICH